MADCILALNAGSSSLKIALFALDEDRLSLRAKGSVEGVDTKPHFTVRDDLGDVLTDKDISAGNGDFRSLLDEIIQWVEGHIGAERLTAVSHRVVHGGPEFVEPMLVTADILDKLDALIPLAPLHQPHNLTPIRLLVVSRPEIVQVVCFDTAFHRTMPAVATRYALPRQYEQQGIRRYGFHGLSYEFIARHLRDKMPALASGRVIVAHLGNGASLCALLNGQGIDTTMGFTPLDGLVMGTRCGELDPGVVLYLERQHGMTTAEVEDLLYHQSGLLGVSGGIASDMRALEDSQADAAKEAIDLFAYRAAREMGALVSSLGGLDGIVFTGGIGQHSANIRQLICSGLRWLEVEVDPKTNDRNAAIISTAKSRISIHVIATDEEAMLAQHAVEILRGLKHLT